MWRLKCPFFMWKTGVLSEYIYTFQPWWLLSLKTHRNTIKLSENLLFFWLPQGKNRTSLGTNTYFMQRILMLYTFWNIYLHFTMVSQNRVRFLHNYHQRCKAPLFSNENLDAGDGQLSLAPCSVWNDSYSSVCLCDQVHEC